MKKLLIVILSWGLISPPALGDDCASPVVPISKGAVASCTGFLFSPSKEQQVRLVNDDYDFMKQQVDILSKQKAFTQGQVDDLQSAVDSQKKEINLWRTDDINNSQKLIKAEEGRGTRDALFLGGGVLITLILSIVANNLRK